MKINGVKTITEILLGSGQSFAVSGVTALYAPDDEHPYWRVDQDGFEESWVIGKGGGVVFKCIFEKDEVNEDGEEVPAEE